MIGQANAATTTTSLQQATAGQTALHAQSDSGVGLRGVSVSNTGLRGDSTSGTAVRAFSTGGRAINATAGGAGAPALASRQSTGGTAAVFGFTGPGGPPAALTETGVHGRCDQSEVSNGVAGTSTTGTGVYGDATNGVGVVGAGFIGVLEFGDAGIVGDVDGGTGVMGWSGVGLAPIRWLTSGLGRFRGRPDRAPGQGRCSLRSEREGDVQCGPELEEDHGPGRDLQHVVRAGHPPEQPVRVWVRAVVPASADGSITIYLNTSVSSTTNVGWMVIG